MNALPNIPFNKPFLIGKELEYVRLAVESGHLSGNGFFAGKVHQFFAERYKRFSLLTNSCTDALEMAAILINIQPGDEVIAPSYAYVSTVNAFVLRGAKIVFVDSEPNHPNLDASQIEALIGPKTKAIVCLHYAGMACDMERLLALSSKYNIPLIEDAAHAIESKWKGEKQLGTLGQFGTFSFHETKNVIAGEGGLLVVNDAAMQERARVVYDKGTNRQAFLHGEVNRYEWVDVGSSFAPSELVAAFLFAQLEELEQIQTKRLQLWNRYAAELKILETSGHLQLPQVPTYAMTNGHIFYLVCQSEEERNALITHGRNLGVHFVFHYQSLHNSPYYKSLHDGRALPNADRFTHCLVRLPIYYEMTEAEQARVIAAVMGFYLG